MIRSVALHPHQFFPVQEITVLTVVIGNPEAGIGFHRTDGNREARTHQPGRAAALVAQRELR